MINIVVLNDVLFIIKNLSILILSFFSATNIFLFCFNSQCRFFGRSYFVAPDLLNSNFISLLHRHFLALSHFFCRLGFSLIPTANICCRLYPIHHCPIHLLYKFANKICQMTVLFNFFFGRVFNYFQNLFESGLNQFPRKKCLFDFLTLVVVLKRFFSGNAEDVLLI